MFWEFRYYEVKILSHFSDLKNERERELRRVSARNFFVKTRNQNRIEKHFPSFGFDFLKLTDYNSALCFTVPVNYNCQDHTQHF